MLAEETLNPYPNSSQALYWGWHALASAGPGWLACSGDPAPETLLEGGGGGGDGPELELSGDAGAGGGGKNAGARRSGSRGGRGEGEEAGEPPEEGEEASLLASSR